MYSLQLIVGLFATLNSLGSSFVPKAFISTAGRQSVIRLRASAPAPFENVVDKFNTLEIADDLSELGVDPVLVNSVSSGVVSTVKNVVLVGGGIVAVILLITVIFATFVIPAAAKELEAKIQQEYPELWSEYQAKLGEGEILSQRPDLIQELGTKVQMKEKEKFDAAQAASQSPPDRPSPSSDSGSSNVIDVDPTKDEKKD